MKAFSAVLLISLAVMATNANEKKMLKGWMVMKSMESCFGEDLIKEYLVRCKTATARCAGTPSPNQFSLFEMDMNPSRAGQALAQNAHTKKHQMAMTSNMVEKHPSGHPAIAILQIPSQTKPEDPMMKMMQMMMTMKMMSKMMSKADRHMKPFKHPHRHMQQMNDDDDDDDDDDDYDIDAAFSDNNVDMRAIMRLVETAMNKRQKRADNSGEDVFELGERLSEKLEMVKQKFEEKMGNFTCVLREFNVINENNELSLDEMSQEFNKIPDMWLSDKMKRNCRLCYAEAESLPAEVLNDCPVGPKLGKIFHFMKCEKKRKFKTCMLNDVRMKLEANFGSLEKLVMDSGVPEKELLPMASHMIQDQITNGFFDDME